MRETLRVPGREVDGKLLQHIETAGAHIPNFDPRYLPTHARMFRRATWVIHPEHAVFDLGGSAGGKPVGNAPI